MKNLSTALQVTPDEYENIVFQNWFNWCSRIEALEEGLQSMVANTSLFNWWYKEYAKFENDFLIEITPYQDAVSKTDAYLQYVRNVHKIHLYYSKPLIKHAKNLNIIPNN